MVYHSVLIFNNVVRYVTNDTAPYNFSWFTLVFLCTLILGTATPVFGSFMDLRHQVCL